MTKHIRVTEEVYSIIEAQMRPRESFSDTIERLIIELCELRREVHATATLLARKEAREG